MGFRFRKSIKIAPGVKLNIGKKSASISFGGKGIRQSISTTGRTISSVGIPGSGLYYTKYSSIGKKNISANKNTYNSNEAYQDVENFNNLIKYLTSLHTQCDYYYNWNDINEEFPPFNILEKGPNELQSRTIVENYKPNMLEKIFKIQLENKMNQLENNINIAKEKDNFLYEEWKNKNESSQSILDGNLQSYMDLLQEVKFSNDLGGMINSFNFKTSNKDTIIIDYHINIEGVIPEQYASLTKTGKLSIKNYTKTAYYEVIKLYVCGLAIRIARNAFGLLPIKNVIINASTLELNTEIGIMEDNIILSILIDEDGLDKLKFDLIDPHDALNNFTHNSKFLKTKGFQPVEKVII